MFGDDFGGANLVHTSIPTGLWIFILKILEFKILSLFLVTIIIRHRIDDQIHKIC